VALALGACGGDAAPAPSTVLPAAPEPARGAPTTAPPAGTVVPLGGGRPEGMVADPVTGLVVVALRDPDRLALLDPAAGAVVGTVPVPGSARHLELAPGGGAVIVPGEDTDLVSTVALPEGRVTMSVKVGKQPHDVAVTGDGTLYTADESGGAVSVIRAGAVVQTFSGLVQPGGAAGTGTTGTVVDVRARLLHVYRDGKEVAALPAGAGPTHAVALQPGVVVVTDTDGGQLLRYEVAGTPQQAGSLPLPGRPYGTAYDAVRRRLFVTATARNLLVEYRVTPAGLEQLATFPTVVDAYSVAVAPATGRVVVAGESGSQLQLVDP
jgi:DNA-binding beta-propeller fold protein YncE